MKHIRFSLLIVSALLIITALVSCGNSEQSEFITIAANGKTDYRIIYPEKASDSLISACISLNRSINKSAGVKMEIAADSEQVRDKNSGKEILVGNTNRSSGVSVSEQDNFTVAVSGESIIILGGSDKATEKAIEYFCNNFLSDTIRISRSFLYIYESPKTSISIDGSAVQHFFAVNSVDDSDISSIVNTFSSKTSAQPSDSEENSTIINICENASLPGNTIRLAESDGAIEIQIPYPKAINYAANALSNGFADYDYIDFSDGSMVDFTYQLKSVLDVPAENEIYFVCETDKNPLSYQKGEEIVFTLTLKADGETVSCPYFNYTVSSDYYGEIQSGKADGSNGVLTLTASLDKPGFIKIYAGVLSSAGVELKTVSPFNGGAAVAIDEITQGITEPDDFDEFWESQLYKLNQIEPNVTIVNDLSDEYPGYKVWDVRIDCIDGPVSGYVSLPEDAGEGSLNILVGYTGYGVSSPQPALRDNSIVFAVNAHSIDNGREPGYYTSLSQGSLRSYGFDSTENSDRETVYFKNMILRDIQALRYLKKLPEWNGSVITLNGGSQGAFQAIAVAALDHDVTYVYVAYTWMCDLGSESTGRLGGWQPDYTDALRYYDSVNFAKRIRCETRIDAGLGDYVSTPSGITAMYNSMSCPRTLNFIQNMTHYYTPPHKDVYSLPLEQEYPEE